MIPGNVLLAPNFLSRELGGNNPAIPLAAEANLWALADYLQHVRNVLGVPLRVTSGYRPPRDNAAVGGASGSDHLTGRAADVVPVGLGLRVAFDRLTNAAKSGTLQPWDQFIFYPGDGHLHIGIGSRLRREVRYTMTGREYPRLTAGIADRVLGSLGGASLGIIALIAIAGVLYILLRS